MTICVKQVQMSHGQDEYLALGSACLVWYKQLLFPVMMQLRQWYIIINSCLLCLINFLFDSGEAVKKTAP